MNELFAVEPTAIETSKDLSELFRNFGFHQGRFIACYPKRWRSLVIDQLNKLPDVARKKAIDLLSIKYANRIIRSSIAYTHEKDWVGNARDQKQDGNVADVIVARGTISEFQTLEEVDEDFFFQWGGRQTNILSSADSYAEAARMLLRHSSEVAIVDPYLSCLKPRYQKVIKCFSDVAMQGKRCRHFICYTLDDGSTAAQVERGAHYFFKPSVTSGLSISYLVLRDMGDLNADDHPRFLVSAEGAMQFDHGFDEENPPRSRMVSVIDPPLHESLYKQYIEELLPFEVVHRIELPGEQHVYTK